MVFIFVFWIKLYRFYVDSKQFFCSFCNIIWMKRIANHFVSARVSWVGFCFEPLFSTTWLPCLDSFFEQLLIGNCLMMECLFCLPAHSPQKKRLSEILHIETRRFHLPCCVNMCTLFKPSHKSPSPEKSPKPASYSSKVRSNRMSNRSRLCKTISGPN